jgi:hypothetical protein
MFSPESRATTLPVPPINPHLHTLRQPRNPPLLTKVLTVSLLSKYGPSSGYLERSLCLLQHLSHRIDQSQIGTCIELRLALDVESTREGHSGIHGSTTRQPHDCYTYRQRFVPPTNSRPVRDLTNLRETTISASCRTGGLYETQLSYRLTRNDYFRCPENGC